MNKLVKYKKDELILISEKPKLRSYEETERKRLVVKLVAELLFLLGVNEGKTEQHNALALHINNNWTNLTFEEIRKAFIMFVNGELNIKPFQQLNAVVFGQVINEFKTFQVDKIRSYKNKMQKLKFESNKMTPQEADKFMENIIEEAKKKFKKNGLIESHFSKYNWLDSKGKLQGNKSKKEWEDYKLTKYYSVQSRLLVDYENMKAQTRDEKNKIKLAIQDIKNKKSNKVINQCKLEILEDYFNNLI